MVQPGLLCGTIIDRLMNRFNVKRNDILKHSRNYAVFVVGIIIIGLFWCAPVFAAECGGVDTALIECTEGGDGGVWHILNLIIDILSIGIGITGVVGISIAGVQYLTAGPNTERTKTAKNRIYQIVIGLVAYIVMFVLLQWLLPGGLIEGSVADVGKVKMDKTSVTVETGNNDKVAVVFDSEDVKNKTVSWKSADSSIATVSGNGVVIGRKTGETTITAITADGQEISTKVTVTVPTNNSSSGSGSNSGSSSGSGVGGPASETRTNEAIRKEMAKVAKKFAVSGGNNSYANLRTDRNLNEYQQAVYSTGVAYDNSSGAGYCRQIGKSCSAYVATVVRMVIQNETGNKFPPYTSNIPVYVSKVNEKYPGTWKTVSASDLQPGDIMYEYSGSFGNSGHTAIMVESGGRTVIAEAAIGNNSYGCPNGVWPHVTGFARGPLYHSHAVYYRYMGGK